MSRITLGKKQVIETQEVTIELSFKDGVPLNEFTKLIQDEIDRQDAASHDESLEDSETVEEARDDELESLIESNTEDLSDIVIDRT